MEQISTSTSLNIFAPPRMQLIKQCILTWMAGSRVTQEQLLPVSVPDSTLPIPSLESYLPTSDLHGWRKCSRIVGTILAMWVAGSLRHTTAMDGGSADIASLHGCNLLGNAGAIAEEQISTHPWIYTHRHPWLFALYDHHGWWECGYCRSKYPPIHPWI